MIYRGHLGCGDLRPFRQGVQRPGRTLCRPLIHHCRICFSSLRPLLRRDGLTVSRPEIQNWFFLVCVQSRLFTRTFNLTITWQKSLKNRLPKLIYKFYRLWFAINKVWHFWKIPRDHVHSTNTSYWLKQKLKQNLKIPRFNKKKPSKKFMVHRYICDIGQTEISSNSFDTFHWQVTTDVLFYV